MVKIKFAALAAVMVAAVATVASAQQATQAGVSATIPDGKIAVINRAALQTQINEFRQKVEQVNNQYKDRIQRIEGMSQQIKQLESDIQSKGPAMPADKLAEMRNSYEDMKKRGQREYEDLQAEYNRAVETATRPIGEKVGQFMNTYAQQRGIVLIIDLAGASQTGSLAWWSPGTDITNDFVNEYNKANPVPVTPGAAQPKPQPNQPTPNKPAGNKQ
ncbi:MAG TPA: OmpH family outer membrane protein [Blastocatellia bacterium]|jgi:Skp family chaperone for outer membrane proteins